MDQDRPLADRLRDRILNALHVGDLQPGDRLPSIRALWKELGVDHRVVAAAYRELEEEGLVEVRGRSGVYVARQDQLGGELLAETARWMGGVMVEAWKRRISIHELPELIRRCTTSRVLRCACVESNVDQMTAYCAELREQFGVDPYPVYISPDPLPRPARSVEFYGVEDRLRECDFAVTTSYHARLVRAAADNVGRPSVTLTVSGDVVDIVQRHLREAPLTVVAVDSVYGQRIRSLYARSDEEAERIRILLADDTAGLAALDPDEPILMTYAAHQRLGDLPNPLLAPHSPTFSANTARDLLETLIRLNVEEQPQPELSGEMVGAGAEAE